MGYVWAIPAVIVAVVLLVMALGARRRRQSGAEKALDEKKPIVP